MKAAVRTGFFGYTLSFAEDHPRPSASESESESEPVPNGVKTDDDPLLLIKVHAGAINPVDYKLPRLALGSVYGLDFCGTVVGNDNDNDNSDNGFVAGDLVFGFSSKGTLAEYTLARTSQIARAPEGWKATDCAALPTAYVSALQCLREGGILPQNRQQEQEEGVVVVGGGAVVGTNTGVTANDDSTTTTATNTKSVLIIGASGGCGLAAVQLCKALGKNTVSRIVAICSSKNRDLVLWYGATEVVDYSDEKALKAFYQENTKNNKKAGGGGTFDCVLDAASNSGGGEIYWNRKTLGLLKNKKNGDGGSGGGGGRYIGLNGPASKWIRFFTGFQSKNERMVATEQKGSDLELVVDLLASLDDENNNNTENNNNNNTTTTNSSRPLTTVMDFDEENVIKGFDLLRSRRAQGKIVFDILGGSSTSP